MPMDPLEGCRKKVARAEVHLQALHKLVEDWGKSPPYEIDKTLDSRAGEITLRLRMVREAPLTDWGIVIGDSVHSMRSALDHLVCAMIRHTDPQASCVGTGFPILLDPQRWERRKKNGELDLGCGLARIRGVDRWSELTIKGLQPFSPGKQTGRDHALWILNELANIDKHRTIHVAEFFHYTPEVTFDPPGSAEVSWIHSGGQLEDGAEIVRYRVIGSGSRITSEMQLGADIVFGEGSSVAEGMNVPKLLKWLRDYVERTVDLFGYKFFGGEEPQGLQRSVVRASRSVSVSEDE